MNSQSTSPVSVDPIFPGAVLGMLGGGQLGRMFVVEAQRLGYDVWVLDPDPASPAGTIANRHLQAAFDDAAALDEMAQCAAVSIEFENIPVSSLRTLSARTRVAPSAECVEIAQNRVIEKNFARQQGVSPVAFGVIETSEDIEAAVSASGFPAILKTASLGYDGKGQAVCQDMDEVQREFERFGGVLCVLEQRVDLACEVSVVLGRGWDGKVSTFPVSENRHVNGILDLSLVPAQVDNNLVAEAESLATKLADAMNYVGVMAVEFFVTTAGEVLMNEMAPRPHNSGHYTLDATPVSQFNQQVRMLCGLAAGETSLRSPVVMLNLLGDRWTPTTPDWSSVYEQANSHLHLYGKKEARQGRKMGHINVLAETLDTAIERAEKLKSSV